MSGIYTGITSETPENLLLDSGAIYVNYDISVDTPNSAKGKLLGATMGGNKFEAVPEIRVVRPDGAKAKVKGLSILEYWDVSMTVNMLEFNEQVYKYALASVTISDVQVGEDDYKQFAANSFISDEDYIDNLTYIGRISGSDKPVIIQIYNALSMEGLTIESKDSDDNLVELKFDGHCSLDELGNPPFTISHPPRRVAIVG